MTLNQTKSWPSSKVKMLKMKIRIKAAGPSRRHKTKREMILT
jgi:hypothetical protein